MAGARILWRLIGNLYSHHSNIEAITDLVGTLRNGVGNLAPQ